MKFLLCILFVLNLFGLSILAQNPPPPPPAPLIYKAPEKSMLKEFVAPDKSFQVTFPGTAETTERKSEALNFTAYRVNREGSNSIVSISEYAANIEGKKEKIYESVKNNLLKAPKSSLESEKDITINGIAGKEFAILQDYNYQRIRVFVSGNRIYGIETDVTNWHILTKYNQDKVRDFNNEADRFFNSFKILK